MKTNEPKIVTIETFDSLVEAQVYQALLESAGVWSELRNDVANQVIPALMQVELLVSEEDAHKAREVLTAKFDKEEFKNQAAASKKEH